MTNLPMKITVRWSGDWFPGKPWGVHCPYCHYIDGQYISWDGAMWEAEQHAAEPCDGIRLALLVGRLMYRREGYECARLANLYRGDLHTAAAYRMVVSNIDHDTRLAAP